MNEAKVGFFCRVKKAIFKFEEYEKFLTEETTTAIAYITKLILIFSIIITIAICYTLKINVQKFISILNNEAPEFKITAGTLQIEDEEKYDMFLEEMNLQLIMDENAESIIKTDYDNGIELLKNKMVIKYMGAIREISYNDIDISKQDVMGYLSTNNLFKVLTFTGIIILLSTFITYSIIIWIDILMLAMLGVIINFIVKIPIKFKEILKIAIYAMTLPIILYLLYSLANVLLGTTIKYFDIAYNAISYVYLVTVFLIIKSDIIKNTQELQRILDEEKKVREELARQKKEEREKQEEANRDREKEKEKKEKGKTKDQPKGEPQTEN